MRLVDIDDIRIMKFLSEEDDPSESDGEREYRNGWNDALTAINDIQPSAEPEDTIEMQESDIDEAMKRVRDARVTILPSAEPEIIRCRECKHMQEDKLFGQYWCRGNEVKPDHFCGYAERRADE